MHVTGGRPHDPACGEGRHRNQARWFLAAASLIAPAALCAQPLSPNDPTRVVPKPSPPASAPLDIHPAPPAPAPQDSAARFVLTGVKFDHAAAVGEARLEPAWIGLKGKPVSLSDLRAIGGRAEAIYAKAGYPFVAVVLRVQEIEGGVVHFDVVEGRISDLTVLGTNPTARRQATAALEPLVNRTPLSVSEVNKTYTLARDIPGLAIAGTLRRGSEPGGMDLVVAARRDEWRTYLNVNDLYADPVGPWGFLVGVDRFGSSEHGDQTSVQVYSSVPFGRQVLVRGSESVRLNSLGTTVGVSGLWGQANPEGNLAPLALATNVATIRAEISQPLWKQPDASLLVDLALEGSDQRTKVFSKFGLSDDKLRDLSLSLSGEKSSPLGRIAATVELHQDIDILGASQKGDPNLSRLGANPEATILRAGMEGEVGLFHGIRLAAKLDTQYSGSPLTAPDQYSVGNLTVGRGYQPGAALGDSAVAGSFEVRFGPGSLGHGLNAQPFVFVDVVKLWNHGFAPFSERTLDSYGGGVRFQIAGKLHMDLLAALPQRPPLGLGDKTPGPTVLVNFTVGLNDLFSAIHRRIASGVGK
jgi:hemolysin activation/secretion protein